MMGGWWIIFLVFEMMLRGGMAFVPQTTLPSRVRHSNPTLASSVLFASSQVKSESLTTMGFFNLTFPSYGELMVLSRGESIASESFSVEDAATNREHTFRVLLYPRGGGHMARNKPIFGKDDDDEEKSGFGMSYKVIPWFQTEEEKVGVYLQYLPKTTDSTIDATFSLRLQGSQSSGPKFDLEWAAGMRFVKEGKLREGTASDFGAHLMQTTRLRDFMGADTQPDHPLKIRVRLSLFHHPSQPPQEETTTQDVTNDTFFSGVGSALSLDDIRQAKDRNGNVVSGVHNQDRVRVGQIVVPVLRRITERQDMFRQGVYPGVEYRIMRVFDKEGNEMFGSTPGATYDLKPIYKLVNELERPWPVRVKETSIPKLYTVGMYNAVSAIGSLFTATFGLAIAFFLSQFISVFVIPSRSMDPTLMVNDVLLVEKLSPRVLRSNNRVGDVVLFNPPTRLQDIVTSNGGNIGSRDLFVKRVAGEPNDLVSVDADGSVRVNGKEVPWRRDLCETEPLRLIEKYIQSGETQVEKENVFVLGDCGSVSIDSRVWGSLSSENIIGKPLFRVWPMNRFGALPKLP